MGTVTARVKKDGTLLLKDKLDERLPVITDGLVAHYPLDSKAGAVDVISGRGTAHNFELRTNILDCLYKSWRDPSSWNCSCVWDNAENALRFDTAATALLYAAIPIDTGKNWYISAEFKTGAGATGGMYFGNISMDANMTTLAGHPGTYDYYGNVGEKPPTTWKLYKNYAIGGAPRTGETSDTNYSTFQTGTKFVYIMILVNYSGTGPTWIRNLKFYTDTMSDTSNLVVSDKGIAVQEATTNLITSTTGYYSPWGGFSGVQSVFTAPNGSQGIALNAITSGGCGWRFANDNGMIAVTPSTIYTISCKLKATNLAAVHANFFYFYQYTSADVYVTEYGIFTSANAIKLDNGYYFVWALLTTSSTTSKIRSQGYEYTGNQMLMAYDFQLEQRSFATAKINGTKPQGLLAISNPVKTGNYTINFKCKILNIVGSNIGYQSIMSMGNYYSTNSWTIMDLSGSTVSGAQCLIRKGNADEWGWASGAFTGAGNFRDENVYTIVRDATYYWCYCNGILVGNINHASTTMQDLIWIGGRNGGGQGGSAIFGELSIYNRVLSDFEIKLLVGEGFKTGLTKSITPFINESPSMPVDSYYFPLSSNTKDSSRLIDAFQKDNLAFEDSACWVGNAVTNIAGDINDWGLSCTKPKKNFFVFTGQQYIVKGFSGAISSPYTMTFRLRATKTGQTIRLSCEAGSSGTGYDLTQITRGTKNYSKKITSTGTGSLSSLLYQFAGDNAGDFSELYVDWVQIENNPFASAYTPSTRGTGALTYNLNASIGLDWSGNWSICYWKMPVGCMANTMTQYNIDSLGSNGNTVGTGYNWWGKDSGPDTIAGSTPSAFTASDYFNKWHFVTLIKSGTTLTIKEWCIGSQTHVRTITVSTSLANFYVNQYGYDLKLGGYDNGNPVNSFYRDLIVCKRALSDVELQNIYKQFSVNKTKINAKYIIEEGI